MESWSTSLMKEFKQLCDEEGEGRELLTVYLHHVEVVKSYAPRISHVVADLYLC
jgi:tRNA G37 N-methylase Trm5